MSNENQKTDTIAYRFYTKLSLVVNDARATAEPKPSAKVDRWFNLETPDSDLFKEQLRVYKTLSVAPPPPRFELQVLLSVPELTHKQVLVHLASDRSRTRIDPTPRTILLESWILTFTRSQSPRSQDVDRPDVAPSTIYKHGIPLFRSVFTLLRILPSWKLYKRLRRRTGGTNRNGNLSIQLRVAPSERSADILDFDTSPAPNVVPLSNDTYVFPSIPHPMGTLAVQTRYLTSPNFQLEELESLLSSRFLSLDEGPEFTPTLSKNHQRDSLAGTGSPESLPIRIPLPRSPPERGIPSIADRFVLPAAHSRTASLPGSMPSTKGLAPPMSRNPSGGAPGSTSGISVTSSGRQDTSSAWSRDDGKSASGLPSRLRKESSGAGRGADLPSAPGPLPIRRPNINPVHPFKSSTLSTGSPSIPSPSPSLRNPSPLSSLHSRPVQSSPRVPPSPIGMGSRPSPPFAPSSIGERKSPAPAEGDDQSPRPQGRKRYSSSFGHRYVLTGGPGSEGSGGSGERRDMERPGSASFLSTNTDDDDISAFVQDIDSRRPLNGHDRLRDQVHDDPLLLDPATSDSAGPQRRREGGEAHVGSPSDGRIGGGSGSRRPATSHSGPGAMLTSEVEVDERLRQMNETFLASLEGLGGGSGGGGVSGGVRRRRAASEHSSRSGTGSRGERDAAAFPQRGRGGRPPLTSPGSRAESDAGGSEEVMGRMSLDGGSRRQSQAL